MQNPENWIAQCESEPLAHSGAIQAYGAMLHVDDEHVVQHVSSNLADYLPCEPAVLLGKPLPDPLLALLEPAMHSLAATPGSRSDLHGEAFSPRLPLDIVAIRCAAGVSFEFSTFEASPTPSVPHMLPMATPANQGEAELLHDKVAKIFHALTGFDRVMVYAFREGGDGEVLAEARREAVYGSYLGLRFPASDIPNAARSLYLINPWRMIPDTRAQPIPLLSFSGNPPNLSWSNLRSVSPVHLAYLSNMGVRASLSFPIVVGKELWGLVACHHAEPRKLPLSTLRTASFVAIRYSLIISTWRAESRMRLVDYLTHQHQQLKLLILEHPHLLRAIQDIGPILLEQFDACGIALHYGREWTCLGEVPDPAGLELLASWLHREAPENIWSCDSLSRTLPHLPPQPVAGALAVKRQTRLDEHLQVWLFRNEVVQEVEWGGNPSKPVEFDHGPLAIAPRLSFEKWVEQRTGFCRTWSDEDRFAATRLLKLLSELYH